MELLNIAAVLQVSAANAINFLMLVATSFGLFFTLRAHNKKLYADNIKDLEIKINCKAEKSYVDQQDKSLHHRIDEIRADNLQSNADLKNTLNTRFEDIKELIKAMHHDTNK